MLAPIDHTKAEAEFNLKKCLVTKSHYPRDEMLRFVVSPTGQLVADLSEKLPGRGYWIKSKSSLVEKALSQNLFEKVTKQKLDTEYVSTDQINHQFERRLMHILGLAKKAGRITNGYEKIVARLPRARNAALIMGREGGTNGDKLLQKSKPFEIDIAQPLTTEQLSASIGKENTVYLLLEDRRFKQDFMKFVMKWRHFQESSPLNPIIEIKN